MEHATVIGTVVATRVHPSLIGVRLLVAQPEDERGRAVGAPLVLADPLQCGPGQRVQWVQGREAALALPAPGPVDGAIVAIVAGFDTLGSSS